MLPWWIRHGAKELPAIVAVATLVSVAVLGAYLLTAPGPHEGERTDGEIVGFHATFYKGDLQATQFAAVRLSDGRIQYVPLEGRAVLHCRRGDRLPIVRRGARFLADPRGCAGP